MLFLTRHTHFRRVKNDIELSAIISKNPLNLTVPLTRHGNWMTHQKCNYDPNGLPWHTLPTVRHS